MPKRKSTPKSNADHYAAIADRIIDIMQRDGIPPWRRPWSTAARGSTLPRNGLSGKPYRGINVLLTMATQIERGYHLPIWITAKQAAELGARAARARGESVEKNARGTWVYADGERKGRFVGGVRKGQRSIEVYLWRPMEKIERDAHGEEKRSKFLLLRSFNVFNVQQLEPEILAYVIEQEKVAMVGTEFDPLARAEEICAGFDCQVVHQGVQAFYAPAIDTIVLPSKRRFNSAASYYCTRFHEMGHATGAEHRLAREGFSTFDFKGRHSEQYAAEELVAEFTACFLAAESGILLDVEETSASYLKGWAAKLKEDPKLLVHAAQRAQKAADLILGRGEAQETAQAA